MLKILRSLQATKALAGKILMKVGTQNIVLSKGIIFTPLAFAKLEEFEFKFIVYNQERRKE